MYCEGENIIVGICRIKWKCFSFHFLMVLLPCQILSDSNCAIYEAARFNQAAPQRKKINPLAFNFVIKM